MAMAESEVQDRNGRWYRMQIRPYKTTDDKIDGAILSLVDIDALKHVVAESQQARGEAEHANQSKDLFLAVLGHELRTPLASLLLQAQLLRRGTAVDAAKLTRVGEVIERATRMQMQLVDDLLDVSRIVAGKLKVQMDVVDLSVVVKAALDGVSGPIQRKSLELDVVLDEAVGAVAGDAARLQQAVSNLLTNAIKFSAERGHITVTLEKVNGCAHIKVSDTGAGIDPGFLPHVFDRFSQADTSNTRMYGGLGLGLAIVRHLVEQHGGIDPGRQRRGRKRSHLLGDAPAHERAARGRGRWGDRVPGERQGRPARPPSAQRPAHPGRGRRPGDAGRACPRCSGRWAPT